MSQYNLKKKRLNKKFFIGLQVSWLLILILKLTFLLI